MKNRKKKDIADSDLDLNDRSKLDLESDHFNLKRNEINKKLPFHVQEK